METNEITSQVVQAAIRVHRVLGPGLLEGTYRACLRHELAMAGLRVAAEVALPISYNGVHLDAGYRVDLLVEEVVIVETKAVAKVTPVHEAQLLSYLKLGRYPVGLLINFNVLRLKNGIRRMICGDPPSTKIGAPNSS